MGGPNPQAAYLVSRWTDILLSVAYGGVGLGRM